MIFFGQENGLEGKQCTWGFIRILEKMGKEAVCALENVVDFLRHEGI
jgi:hypothetical protein